jgi:hypothetical protein
MQRYKQRFNGMGTMDKCDTGDWVKNEEAESVLHWNEQSLFEVIKERNEEIAQMQQDFQNFADNCEEDVIEMGRRNTKLFYLLAIATAISLVAIAAVGLSMLGVC